MPTLKFAAAMIAAALALAPAAAFADQGGTPNSHAKANTHAHPNPNKTDPQPTKGNDGSGGVMPCDACTTPPGTPGVILTR